MKAMWRVGGVVPMNDEREHLIERNAEHDVPDERVNVGRRPGAGHDRERRPDPAGRDSLALCTARLLHQA